MTEQAELEPSAQEVAQPPLAQEPPPPNSLEADMHERQALEAELKQSEASIESDFAKACAESLNSDDEELFFNDKEAFIKLVLQKQNDFLNSQIAPKLNRINELDSQIAQKKSFAEIESAQNDFLQSHPDADINELIGFYEEDLPPRYKKELDNLSASEFFRTLYELYKRAQGSEQEQEEVQSEELPQRLEGNPSEAESGVKTSMMSRF